MGRRVERLVKLVRSRAGTLWRATSVDFRKIERDDHVRLLRQKLIEEAAEYITDPSVGELADVLDVLRALAEIDQGVGWDDVLIASRRRRHERGDYMEGVALYMSGTLNEGAVPDDQAVVLDG